MTDTDEIIDTKEIIRNIIKEMEKGVMPWRKPWSANTVVIGSMLYDSNLWPSNLRAPTVPFGVYNGILLLMQARIKNYRTNLWITAKTRKYLKADLIDSAQQATRIRNYYSDSDTLYNIDQIKNCEKILGLSFNPHKEQLDTHKKEHLCYEKSEKLHGKLNNNGLLKIVPGNYAAYSPSEDLIIMPKIEQFNNSVGYDHGKAHYWATLWHEVVHWTGHKNRLNRTLTGRFGDPDYAFEELIAELGTTFLCASMGIKGELQHASYIKSWLKILKNDPDRLWEASRHADDAHKYIFAFNREPKLMPYYR